MGPYLLTRRDRMVVTKTGRSTGYRPINVNNKVGPIVNFLRAYRVNGRAIDDAAFRSVGFIMYTVSNKASPDLRLLLGDHPVLLVRAPCL